MYAKYTHIVHSDLTSLRAATYEDFTLSPSPADVPSAQVHTAPGGLYLCPCGFLTSGLSKVRTRLLPLNERERSIRAPRTRFTWIPRRGSKPDHNGTRVTGFARHRPQFVRLHLGNSRDAIIPDGRANRHGHEMRRKCSRSYRSRLRCRQCRLATLSPI